MGQTTLDSLNYVKIGSFRSLGEIERAKEVYRAISDKGYIKLGNETYTMHHVGTLVPGKVTKSFIDFLNIECNISKENLIEAKLAVIR